MEGEQNMPGKVCRCPHHKIVPWLIILVGVDFLLGNMNVLTWGFVNITWPILIIIVGIVKLVHCNCCSKVK